MSSCISDFMENENSTTLQIYTWLLITNVHRVGKDPGTIESSNLHKSITSTPIF